MTYDYFKPHSYDKSATVTSLLERSMKTYAEKTAIVYKDRCVTYKELDILSGRIARFVSEKGIGKEQAVSILLSRSEMMIVAAIGVLRAGAAYQPLDPSYPVERLNFMVEDSEAVLLITEDSLRDRVSGYTGDVLNIADIYSLPDRHADGLEVSPEDLFILLYTSGSTGVPKGVMLEQGNLVAFIDWYTRYFNLNSDSKAAAYASFGFDASMMDTYPVLTAGGQLHIISEDIRMDFPRLNRYFEDNGITHSFITTQVGRQYAELYPESKSLKHLSVGGETLVPINPPKDYRFYNGYGPTECTIFTTIFHVDKKYKNVPIGFPLDNVKLYIVDENGKQVETGEEGELLVAGPQVGRGYLKRPEKTAEVFKKNPFSDEPGCDRVYCTGDIVKGLEDGTIIFVGRRDGQVKIRGFRIELSEIEEVIRRFDGVKDATVAAFDKPTGGKFIAAYVVSDEVIDTKALHEFIAKTKPPYMVPSVTMQIDAIPLNQNQKVDRKKLPVPEYQQEDYEAPQTQMEKLICEKMAIALSTDLVGVNDDFFNLGGDSITSIRLITECNHPGVNAASIYKYRTPRALAAYCDSLDKEFGSIDEENERALKTPQRITPEQLALVKMQSKDKETTALNEPNLFRLKPDVDTQRLAEVINRLRKHHPALLSKIELDDNGDYVLVYDEALYEPVRVVDLSEKEFADEKKKLVKPFALTGESFMRCCIYRTEKANYLFLDIHHLLSDGNSFSILYDEIAACMENPDYELSKDYYYYILNQYNEAPSGENYREAKEYYQQNYHEKGKIDKDKISLKVDYETDERKGKLDILPLPVHKSDKTGNILFMTACAMAMARFNESDRAFLYWIHDGRDDNLKMNTFGYLIKVMPLYLVIEDGDEPKRLMEKTEEQVEFGRAHSSYPYVTKLTDLNKPVRFIYQKNLITNGSLGSIIEEKIPLEIDNSNTPGLCGISIIDNDSDERLFYVNRYSASSYSAESMKKFYEYFIEASKKLQED